MSYVPLPIFKTDRLILREVTSADIPCYIPSVPPTLAQQTERCVWWAKRKSPDGTELWLNWAARDKRTGEIAAHIQAGVKDDGIASVAYVVGRKFQRTGVATECLEALFQYLKEGLLVHEVKAWSDTRNEASHRLARKMGMVQVELIKNADTFKGSTSDECVFSKVF